MRRPGDEGETSGSARRFLFWTGAAPRASRHSVGRERARSFSGAFASLPRKGNTLAATPRFRTKQPGRPSDRKKKAVDFSLLLLKPEVRSLHQLLGSESSGPFLQRERRKEPSARHGQLMTEMG